MWYVFAYQYNTNLKVIFGQDCFFVASAKVFRRVFQALGPVAARVLRLRVTCMLGKILFHTVTVNLQLADTFSREQTSSHFLHS